MIENLVKGNNALSSSINESLVTFRDSEDQELITETLAASLLDYEVNLDLFTKGNKVIGTGSFAVVFLVQHKINGKCYALKSIKTGDGFEEEEKQLFFNEVEILTKLNHPCVLSILGYAKEPQLSIVTNYISNGSLETRLSKKSDKLTDSQILIIIYGIALGMRYLHSQNVIHRDLKPANVLLNDDLEPIVSDFGLSRLFSSDISIKKSLTMSKTAGTPIFSAPEIYKDKYTCKVDVYSFALIVYQMVTSKRPFEKVKTKKELKKLVENGKRPQIPNYLVHDSYKKLIRACWAQQHEKRPSFDDVVNRILEGDFPGSDSEEFKNYVVKVSDKELLLKYNFPVFEEEDQNEETLYLSDFISSRSNAGGANDDLLRSVRSLRGSKLTLNIQERKEYLKSRQERRKQILLQKKISDLTKSKPQLEVPIQINFFEKQDLIRTKTEGRSRIPLNMPALPIHKDRSTNDCAFPKVFATARPLNGKLVQFQRKSTIFNRPVGLPLQKAPSTPIVYYRKKEHEEQPANMDSARFQYECGMKLLKEDKSNDAIYYFHQSAIQNNVYAQYQLGRLLIAEKKIDEGLKFLQLSADAGLSAAQYEYGINIESTDPQTAQQYIKKALDQQNKDAQRWYGIALLNNENESKACLYFRLAANQEDIESCYLYGKMLLEGRGTAKNEEEAKFYLKVAADGNHPKAQFIYAIIANDDTYLEKAIKMNDPDAQYAKGKLLYRENWNNEENEEALKYFKLAADQNHAEAQYRLAIINEDDKLMKKAADNNYPEAMYEYSHRTSNENEQIAYLKLAAIKGVTKAQYEYGEYCYSNDDLEKAAQYLKLAADKGHTAAILLYTMFNPISEEESERYFKNINSDTLGKAVIEGNHEAEFWIGLRCLNKNLVEAAADYLKRAADAGIARAMYEYGKLIEPQNQAEGELYLRKALGLNNKDAQAWYALVCLNAHDLSKALHYLRLVGNLKPETQLGIAIAINSRKSSFKSKAEEKELFNMIKDTTDPQTMFEISKYLESENNDDYEIYLKNSSNFGCPDAQVAYGKRLMTHGKIKEGIELIKTCADRGFPAAQFEYANYIKSYDIELAKLYYKKSADNGNEDALHILEWEFRQTPS